MIDRHHPLHSLLRIAPLLAALLACGAARANGDHPMRLPPPDPGPALAKIAAEMKAAALAPAALPEPVRPVAAREPGEAIFSPFSASSVSAASPAAIEARASAAPVSGDNPDLSFTLLAAFGGLVVGAYLWRRSSDAH